MKKFLILCGAVAGLTACGTSSEPDYYMLTAVNGTTHPDMTANFQVERPALPDYLDRPEIVYQGDNHQVSFDEMQRWAAPLDTMVEDILAEDLRQRLPNSVITKEEDYLTTRPSVTIEPEIESFNATDHGSVLKAQILIANKQTCGNKKPLSVAFQAISPRSDVVTAQSGLVAALADQIVLILGDNQGVFCSDNAAARKE